ncbi:hypothetical protein CkaCkLH20_13083 [Colletotrichum karsti]|uniref:DUF7892 domain-containing protein n=1 Tax=Colletotrichum karsti TaxID=1095194 RepID=A0A9P6HW85_9PEZI|nr:uncharacterized protein CkaCkLH20_13083 [Colletotrichum karsti]KAF9869421.1 hypothetical protein CkaCkLH20_13083 [Colletotrichum karsti]
MSQSKPPNVRHVDSQCRPEKTRDEAAALKALRRAEIERRAMLIEPPLPPNVLVHVPSFQAAIQITAPVDDNAWELLRPRLLAQRADAEERENEIIEKGQTTVVAASGSIPKEVTDKDWDDIQGPVRSRMARYADEMIRNTWGKGRKVNKENSPRFAAEVLLSVRARFYADVAEDAAAALAAGRQPQVDPPEGPFTQKLTLENMKWVFDMKIKAHTESYRKELFLCNGCDSNRFYGFEGVIQHYAAKHTKVLSVGNVVVHWRAEWPEEPPFNPNPRGSKNSRHGPSQQQHTKSSVPAHQDKNAFSSNGNVPHSLPPHPDSAGPALPPTYPFQHFDPYSPPPAYFVDGSFPRAPYSLGYGATGALQPPLAITSYGQYYSGAPEYPPTMVSPSLPVPNQHNGIGFHGQARPPYSAPQNMPYPRPYHAQLDDLAQNAKSVWNSLSSVKDLPGPLKVYVTIHQVLNRFESKYFEIPSLRMFNDGLSNHKEMRPVRNINGLLCRACTLGLGNAPYISHDRKSFSLPQLVNHFENRHVNAPSVESQSQSGLDWTQDMVLLPEMHEMSAFQTNLRSRGHQFNLVYGVAPWVFNLTKPDVSSKPQWLPASGYPHDSSSRQFEDTGPTYPTLPAGRDVMQPSWSDSDYAAETAATHQENHLHGGTDAVGCNTRPPAPHSSHWESGTARHSVSSRYGPHAEMNGRHHRDFPPGHRLYSSQGLSNEERNIVRGQIRAPEMHPTGSPIEPDRGYSMERGTRYHQSGQAEPVRPRPGPRQSSTIPQERLLGSDGSMTVADHSKVIRANQPDDFSLTAALESHLAQERDEPLRQQKSETSNPERQRVVRDLKHGRRSVPQDDRYQDVEHYHGSQARGRVEERYGRYETAEVFRGRYYPDSYGATELQRRAGPHFPDRLPDRREAEYLRTDENRSLPLRYEEAYEETYEIVHVRDAEGEYVIRRPILREREPSRMLHDDHYPAHPERNTHLPSRPDPVYDPPVHEGRPAARTPLTRMREHSAMHSRAAVDTLSHEEYDPRNPAPVGPPSVGRDYGR